MLLRFFRGGGCQFCFEEWNLAPLHKTIHHSIYLWQIISCSGVSSISFWEGVGGGSNCFWKNGVIAWREMTQSVANSDK